MLTSTQRLKPPSWLPLLLELRAGFELGAGLAALPWLRLAPAGDGHPVLVLPGLGASDSSTRLLRDFLSDRGYQVNGWGLGRNHGPRPGVVDAMLDSLDRMNDESGRKVSIVGWSLGGVYARALAAKRAGAVRSVITMGSPINDPRVSYDERIAKPMPTVPTTSIYSRTDAIIAWEYSVAREGPQSENIEVAGSHIGLGVNPAVLYAISDRLAQRQGEWRRFQRTGWRRSMFPVPQRVEDKS